MTTTTSAPDTSDGAAAQLKGSEEGEAGSGSTPRARRWKLRLPRLDWTELRPRIVAWLRGQVTREVGSSIVHVLLLMILLALLRPAFMILMPAEVYQADSVFGEMLDRDLAAIAEGSRKHNPVVPGLLFLAVPTVLLLLARRGLRWSEHEHGQALRLVVVIPLAMMAWAGSTFDYNTYLDQGHPFDRLLLVAVTIVAWYTPLAVPIATRLAMVMLKEMYIPILSDDFDFRAPAEFLIIASIFVWASGVSKSFKVKHFVVVFLASWAAYYYAAGMAKWNIGPDYAWLLENKLTNVAVAGYVRGWLSFLDESTYMGLIALVRHTDVAMAAFTLFIEAGSIIALFVHPRVSRWWFLGLALLNIGIFVMTGIFFWKWIFANFVFAWWITGPGRRVADTVYREKLVLLVGVASVWWSLEHYRVLYWSTRVAWWDTRVTQNYQIWAIGESGERYLVDPASVTPMDPRFVQGAHCSATNDHSLTGIYATSGSYGVMKKLETFERPEQALALFERQKRCGYKKKAELDAFLRRYFGNLNRHGRKHRWISWIGRPAHIWVFPKGNLYDMQERVVRIEIVRQLIYHHGEKLHNLDEATLHSLDIAEGEPPAREPVERAEVAEDPEE